MIVISDTSSLTTLLQIGKADLLRQLYGRVLIPEAVRSELLVSHSSLPEFLHCEAVHDFHAVERLRTELDLGEAEAIVLALEQKADLLLIDERNGRRVAFREGIPFTGLIGVLVESKRQHLIPSVRKILNEIEDTTTFYVSEPTKILALKSAGEL